METLKTEPRNQERKLQTIASIYLHLLANSSNPSTIRAFTHIESFPFIVELAYSLLPYPLKQIINNDFFYQAYPGWWKSIYKKNNYLKLRALAVNTFLEAYHEIA